MCLFRNKSKTIQLKFGVPFFDVFDTRFKDISAPVAVRGEIVFHVKNFKKFLKRNGYKKTGLNEFQENIKSALIRYVKEFVINAPIRYGISVVRLEQRASRLSDLLKGELVARIKKQFKVEVFAVDITAIEVDKTSIGYRKLKEITTDIEIEKELTRAEIEIEEMRAHSQIDREDERERAKINRIKENSVFKKMIPFYWFVGSLFIATLLFFIVKSLL